MFLNVYCVEILKFALVRRFPDDNEYKINMISKEWSAN